MDVSSYGVIDADTHLTEPPDLWTDRLPRKYSESGPRIAVDHASGLPRWRLGDRWLAPAGLYSHAGWKEFPPSVPPTFEEIDPACYDAIRRSAWMDEHGIAMQVLYPNLVAFEGHAILSLSDVELRLLVVRAYNDYLHDFVGQAPGRFVGIAAMPFWDRDAAIAEMTRCRDLGHRGVLWAATLEKHGLPGLTDPHWDPFYAAAQDMGMSINLHIGVGQTGDEMDELLNVAGSADDRASRAAFSALAFMSNASTLARILMSDLCERFPRLNFVSVESGFGWVPFLIEALDWSWRTNGGRHLNPERLLPSEYFRRQVFTMYWFEETTLPLLSLFPDNVMFETDFPHKTSLAPGPGTVAPSARELVGRAVERLGEPIMRKVLHDNAAKLYRLE